jgi:hypothetical protein
MFIFDQAQIRLERNGLYSQNDCIVGYRLGGDHICRSFVFDIYREDNTILTGLLSVHVYFSVALRCASISS